MPEILLLNAHAKKPSYSGHFIHTSRKPARECLHSYRCTGVESLGFAGNLRSVLSEDSGRAILCHTPNCIRPANPKASRNLLIRRYLMIYGGSSQWDKMSPLKWINASNIQKNQLDAAVGALLGHSVEKAML
jgi:hypothetical protein